ncbi:MAG TPA: hypothetical protein PKJ19_13520 [Flavobacteriales bacterium]|nr:hypothetical protein [Flavobacteriales bacterium]
MRVLIGCEESQTVCKAFRERGHEAYSCDLKECSGGHPEWHIRGDVVDAISSRKWDFIGLHPVCTKMTLSGNRHYAPGKDRHHERLEAVEWTVALWMKAVALSPRVYMENPMGAMNGDPRLPEPQIIQPYYFGDEAQKTTCLWLKGLPRLVHRASDDLFGDRTHVDRGEMYVAPSGKVMPKWYADSSTSGGNEKNRAIRSKTFPGIARAMAEQWGETTNIAA